MGGLTLDLERDTDRRPAELAIVDRYRRAARAIVEANLPTTGPTGWAARLVLLGQEMHLEPEPIRRWAQDAVCAEVGPLYGADPEAGWPHPPKIPDRMLALRRDGYEVCPTCMTPTPSLAEMRRWAGLRLLAAKRRDVRRGAIHG
jgi:hypothetical protein